MSTEQTEQASALSAQTCAPCNGELPALSADDVKNHLSGLNKDWELSDDNTSITRKIGVKGYAKAVYLANLCAWIADNEGHHPDVSFGWGYCTVTMTTHELGGLSINDFIWASKLDDLVDRNS